MKFQQNHYANTYLKIFCLYSLFIIGISHLCKLMNSNNISMGNSFAPLMHNCYTSNINYKSLMTYEGINRNLIAQCCVIWRWSPTTCFDGVHLREMNTNTAYDNVKTRPSFLRVRQYYYIFSYVLFSLVTSPYFVLRHYFR